MTHLDLDPTVLADAGQRVRSARTVVGPLAADAGTGGTGLGDSGLGDSGLTAAYEELVVAWSATHRALVADLDSLADALEVAARTFADAEQGTAHTLGRLLAGESW